MHNLGAKDGDRVIDWSGAAEDYLTYRPDYPDALYEILHALGVGRPDQRVLDLGTGIGFLARRFARQGARVSACDIAAGSVEAAARAAAREGLEIDFFTATAERTGLDDDSFDLISAAQCWLYFDKAVVIPEVRRLLDAGGRLMTCHSSWLAREDAIAAASEQLILAHNPDWSAADWDGVVPPVPAWSTEAFTVDAFVCFDLDVPFTHEAWRGRIRASRGIGATLSADEVEAFDREHAALLGEFAPDPFTIRHRVDAHLLRPR